MRRFTRSYRTRKNIPETSALRDQFIRQLTAESEALLKQLSEQFNQTLQTQITQLTQTIVAGDGPAATPASSNNVGTIGSVGQLLATGARYLVSRPRTSRDTQESSRSIDANSSFKLSQSQAASEMRAALGQGDKNA
jgi:hypothetical protein